MQTRQSDVERGGGFCFLVVIGCELLRGTSHLWRQEESPRSRPLIAHHAARFSTGLHAHALLSDSGVVQMMETMQPNRPLSLCSELDLEISSRLQYSIDELYHLSADIGPLCVHPNGTGAYQDH